MVLWCGLVKGLYSINWAGLVVKIGYFGEIPLCLCIEYGSCWQHIIQTQNCGDVLFLPAHIPVHMYQYVPCNTYNVILIINTRSSRTCRNVVGIILVAYMYRTCVL